MSEDWDKYYDRELQRRQINQNDKLIELKERELSELRRIESNNSKKISKQESDEGGMVLLGIAAIVGGGFFLYFKFPIFFWLKYVGIGALVIIGILMAWAYFDQ